STFTQHQTYYLVLISPDILSVRTWHAGEQKVFEWAARPGHKTTDTNPATVTLEAQLYGPFSEREIEAFQGQATDPLPSNRLVAAAPAVSSDTWTNSPRTQTLNLPRPLPAGNYLCTVSYVETINANVLMRSDETRFEVQVVFG